MKKLTVIFLLSFVTTYTFGQEKLINKMVIGDTLKVILSRIGDRFGPYDQDTLEIIKTKEHLKLYSEKQRKWYYIDKHALKTLEKMERKGIRNKEHPLSVDEYKLTLKNKTTTFSLYPFRFDNFMLELKPAGRECLRYL